VTAARMLPATVYSTVKLNIERPGLALGSANLAAPERDFFRAKLRILFSIYRIRRARRHTLPDRSVTRDAFNAMLNWLTGNCELFGSTGQNWMLVVAGGLLLYIVMLAISYRRQAGAR
jgi:hypothetical protein